MNCVSRGSQCFPRRSRGNLWEYHWEYEYLGRECNYDNCLTQVSFLAKTMIVLHKLIVLRHLGRGQTPHSTCAESNANEGEQRVYLICNRFDRLMWSAAFNPCLRVGTLYYSLLGKRNSILKMKKRDFWRKKMRRRWLVGKRTCWFIKPLWH